MKPFQMLAWCWMLSPCVAAFAQGPLTPPGAPAATMRSLAQIEPRTPVTNAPASLSQPGAYYLTAHLTGTVTFAAHNVALDLMGFSIVSVSGSAIQQSGARTNLVVRNGTLSAPTGNGIDFSTSSTNANGLIENLIITRCQNYGLVLGGGYRVRNCQVNGTGMAAIRAGNACDIQDCLLTGNGTGLQLTGSGSYIANNIVKYNGDNYNLAQGNHLNLLISQVPESLDWPCTAILGGSLTSTGFGIQVTASGVTLDLNGQTLKGTPSVTSASGVLTAGGVQGVTVRNGTIQQFGYAGVDLNQAIAAKVAGIQALSNGNYGVALRAARGCDMNDCRMSDNGSAGAYLAAVHGSRLQNCLAQGNTLYGIYMTSSGGAGGVGNVISGCSLYSNGWAGIRIYANNGSWHDTRIENCQIANNGSGIWVLAGTASDNCDDTVIRNCTIARNGGNGIIFATTFGRYYHGTVIEDCAIHEPAQDAIVLYHCRYGRVDGNTITRSSSGVGWRAIFTDGATCSGNLIVRNMAGGFSSAYSLSANDTYGPTITASGALAGTDPWANFSR